MLCAPNVAEFMLQLSALFTCCCAAISSLIANARIIAAKCGF